MSTGPALAVLATIAAVPVLVGAGVYRGHVNKEISEEVDNRATSLPVEVSTGQSYALYLIFPLAPSPQAVEIQYTSDGTQHSLDIDTTEPLQGLHLPPFDVDKTDSRTKDRRPGSR